LNARRDVDSSRSSALTMTLVSKMKRKLRFFQESFQSFRRKASGVGLLAEIAHDLFQGRGIRCGQVPQPEAQKRLHLPLVASGRRLVSLRRFRIQLDGDRLLCHELPHFGIVRHAILQELVRSSVGIGVICETWSFPRKRESTPQAFANVLSADWIPAFAGMTGGSSGSPFQMTPTPFSGGGRAITLLRAFVISL